MPRSDRFVNPYSFVALPSVVERRTPPGHDLSGISGAALYSGTVVVTWTLCTPLLLPDGEEAQHWTGDGEDLVVPGSSLKGVIRSVHEAMFAGCARIIDGSFLPGYRDPAVGKPAAEGWRLARVTKADDGHPRELQLCASDVVWVDASELAGAYRSGANRLPASGDTFSIDGRTRVATFGDNVSRSEMHAVSSITDLLDRASEPAVNRMLLLVTDTSVRLTRKKQGSKCYWAVGRLTEERADITKDALSDFQHSCAGTRDRQELLRRNEALDRAPDISADWPAKDVAIAMRRPATGLLQVGDVVWARVDDDEGTAVQLSLAQIWRHAGRPRTWSTKDALPAEHRLPGDDVLPCTTSNFTDDDPHSGLCLSCEVFGSADTSGERAGRGLQESYRGHVRIGPAISVGAVERQRIHLAPLGTPRPGAGMFYLEDRGRSGQHDDLPGQWGSPVDRGTPRQLRGRKFYWHHDPAEQVAFWRKEFGTAVPNTPRYEARDHQRRKRLGRPATIVTATSQQPVVLRQMISLDAVTEVGLRSLLAAIDPSRVLRLIPGGANRTYAHHLGGGKPFGLGTATAAISSVDITSVAQRYSDVAVQSQDDWAPAPGDPALFVPRAGRVSRHWPQLMRILAVDGLRIDGMDWRPYVSYPTGDTWRSYGSQPFDESFRFFTMNTGQALRRGPEPWEPLPGIPEDPTAAFDPSLPYAPRDRTGRHR